MIALYDQLEAANHSVSYAAHLMDLDPSDATLGGYEAALDYAASIRHAIGTANKAELARLDAAACR